MRHWSEEHIEDGNGVKRDASKPVMMLLMREGTGHASSHVGKIASFAYVIGFTCANTAFLHTSCSF